MKNNMINDVKGIFHTYRKNKLIIQNFDAINNTLEKNITEEELKGYEKFIDLIDNILNELDINDSWILKNIFLEKKDKYDLHYSDSTFYWRLRKASANFMEFIKW